MLVVGLAVLTVVTLLVSVVAAVAFERRIPSLRRASKEGPDPRVAVIVPARNEAETIERCVRSLRAQQHADVAIRIVDDGSTDATVERARAAAGGDARVRVLRAPPLAPGWYGKPAALAFGAGEVEADWLLFVDADVELAPDAVRSAVDSARRYGATFLSVWPRQLVSGYWDGHAQPWIVGLAAVGNALLRLWSEPFPAALSAWGPFILIESAAYRRTGGHALVRDRVLEDVELAHAFRRAGEPAVVLDGRGHVTVRMYAGLGDLVQGWGKNMNASLGSNGVFPLLTVVYVLLLGVAPTLLALTGLARGDELVLGLSALALLLQAALGRAFAERVEVPVRRRWTAASPVGALLVAAVIAYSLVRAALGLGVRWKDRTYARETLNGRGGRGDGSGQGVGSENGDRSNRSD